ncbi:uncharacterized protein LOC136002982 [Caloenas nicobarica]|uniref:uncharacterized protein LOC136002982 n=1 Tax=Caloenas nicobarica TaxID=187106 RepID=UPI0032B81F62
MGTGPSPRAARSVRAAGWLSAAPCGGGAGREFGTAGGDGPSSPGSPGRAVGAGGGALSGQDLGEGVRRMEPGSSRWQPVVQETHRQLEQMLQQEKEQRAAQLLWQRQDARQERAELLAQHQQRLSALEQQHQLERLQELQRLYQHLAAWTEPEWGLGDLMAHGAPSWPSSPALDPNTQSEEQQALSASRSMDRARVGTWRPHGPWGPIMAQFTSPGPKYSVRGTTGYLNHNPLKPPLTPVKGQNLLQKAAARQVLDIAWSLNGREWGVRGSSLSHGWTSRDKL